VRLDRAHLPRFIEGARTGYAAMQRSVRALDERRLREPSLLPAWTRAHVIAHVARNADSHVRRLTAAMEGRIVEQYEGGMEGRAADIERAAAARRDELVDDFEQASQALFALWDRMPPETWDADLMSIGEGKQPAWWSAWSRWNELDVHHVDLAADYHPDDWPDDLVACVFEAARARSTRLVPPGLTLVLIDPSGAEVLRGGEGEEMVVQGAPSSLAAWILGRSSEGVATASGEALPTLGAWG
jgi:maleylpyruvate isomerase